MTDAMRWRAVASRDSSYDGIFVYCVKTTRIYCRPPEAEKIKIICKVLDDLSPNAPLPGLKTMAETAGLSMYHFHRQFKKMTGMTPREYALAARSVESSSTATPLPAVSETTPNQETDSQVLTTWAFSNTLSCKYSVVSTTHGLLLIVFRRQELYKLELCTDHAEVKDSLERAFPSATYSHDCIDLEDDEYVFMYRQHIDAVVEALERPSGKMLEIALSVAC
ncbi:hypothetical protein LTR17_026401 [Elasticomyces elasticus]|nr:hypothetical protein LTR17_026401 [Elasticomyces elasticus]